jgi:hypothetical protein
VQCGFAYNRTCSDVCAACDARRDSGSETAGLGMFSLSLSRAPGGFGMVIGDSGHIRQVTGGAAVAAGFRPGLQIVAVDGAAVGGKTAIVAALSTKPLGQSVSFGLVEHARDISAAPPHPLEEGVQRGLARLRGHPDATYCAEQLRSVLLTIAREPDMAQLRRLRCSKPRVRELLRVDGVQAVLEAVGFELMGGSGGGGGGGNDDDDECLRLPQREGDVGVVLTAARLIEDFLARHPHPAAAAATAIGSDVGEQPCAPRHRGVMASQRQVGAESESLALARRLQEQEEAEAEARERERRNLVAARGREHVLEERRRQQEQEEASLALARQLHAADLAASGSGGGGGGGDHPPALVAPPTVEPPPAATSARPAGQAARGGGGGGGALVRSPSVRAAELQRRDAEAAIAKVAEINETLGATGINFVDPSFRPSPESIGDVGADTRGARDLGVGPMSQCQWKRVQELSADDSVGWSWGGIQVLRVPQDPDAGTAWSVFNAPCPEDVQQGALGDCWFLSALAVLAERGSTLLERVVRGDSGFTAAHRVRVSGCRRSPPRCRYLHLPWRVHGGRVGLDPGLQLGRRVRAAALYRRHLDHNAHRRLLPCHRQAWLRPAAGFLQVQAPPAMGAPDREGSGKVGRLLRAGGVGESGAVTTASPKSLFDR